MALPTHIQLQIVSADRSLVNETVDEVEIPGSEGYFGVLPGHTPLLALLGAGELWYRQGQEKHYLSIAYGFAEVQPDRVVILAQLRRRPTRSTWRARKRQKSARRSGWRGPWSTSITNARESRCSSRSSASRLRLALESARNCCQTSPT